MNTGRITIAAELLGIALRLPTGMTIIGIDWTEHGQVSLAVASPDLPANDEPWPRYTIEITKDVPRWTFKNRRGEIVAANLPARV